MLTSENRQIIFKYNVLLQIWESWNKIVLAIGCKNVDLASLSMLKQICKDRKLFHFMDITQYFDKVLLYDQTQLAQKYVASLYICN